MKKKLMKLSTNRELINYSCEELPYTKMVYNLSPAKFGKTYGLGFIAFYLFTLIIYNIFYFSIDDAKTLFGLSVPAILLNFLWFSSAIFLRRGREKKWLQQYSNGKGLKFSDALFMCRIEKIEHKIQELEISAEQIAVIISELDL